MGNKKFILILVAAAAAKAVCAQGLIPEDARYTQEGDHWVRTISGVAPAHAQLIVSARAKIVLRGGSSGDRITYKLIQKVRARDEAQARQWMGAAMGET